ncbi:MAG TPA: exodeoxyribonuclease VII large subunit [Tepidisphaeraceae bacterium]|nr:exodeoxyribonuclease VII large subunit [Tepidisphaeraceae bacterium]
MDEGSFFEFHEQMRPRRRAAGNPVTPLASQSAISAGGKARGLAGGQQPITVSQLTQRIDRVIKTGLPESHLVRAQISNFRPNHSSGHFYFTLKDAASCIDCVMWKSDAARLKFAPTDGMELLAVGKVGIYGQRGKYQLYVSTLRPLGQGALELAFQQLRAKLEAQGLFAADRKKPLPRFPGTLVLVTGRDTAALADMLKVLRRFPWLGLLVYPVPVQGEGAAAKIASALNHISARGHEINADLILLARGGGSLEDLWAFNEEAVARAIADCRIPVITGIGHEVDTSIADLVADHHAHTPTEAAQVAAAHWRGAREAVDAGTLRLRRGCANQLQNARHRLAGIERHEVFRRPMDRINSLRQLLDDRQRAIGLTIARRLHEARWRVQEMHGRLGRKVPEALRLYQQKLAGYCDRLNNAAATSLLLRRQQLDAMDRQLQAVGPQNVLRRGYTITTRKKDGSIVRSAAQIAPGDRLLTRFDDGQVESIAQDSKQLSLFE